MITLPLSINSGVVNPESRMIRSSAAIWASGWTIGFFSNRFRSASGIISTWEAWILIGLVIGRLWGP